MNRSLLRLNIVCIPLLLLPPPPPFLSFQFSIHLEEKYFQLEDRDSWNEIQIIIETRGKLIPARKFIVEKFRITLNSAHINIV